MPAYSIAEVDVLDTEAMKQYSELAAGPISANGGRLVFQGVPELADWLPGRRIAVYEFPTMTDLQAWYGSPEYARAREVGERAMTRNLVFLNVDADG